MTWGLETGIAGRVSWVWICPVTDSILAQGALTVTQLYMAGPPAAKTLSCIRQEYKATSEFPGRKRLRRISRPTPSSRFIDAQSEAQ